MKKFVAMLLALSMVPAFAACAKTDTTETTAAAAETTAAAVETTAAAEETTAATESTDGTEAATVEVMTHEEYLAAAIDDQVCVETYVQATQSWLEDKITVYCQSPEGAVFAYDMACSEEDAAKLVPGTKIRITGYKAEWSGEVEIMRGTFEFVEGGDTYIAEALDVTDLLGTDELIDHQNEFVSFTGLTVEPSTDANGNEAAFLYSWDGSGSQGDDLYFNVSVNGETDNFCVESYLRGADTDVYKAVEALQVGDVINAEGFLYWYEGVNPHITSVTVAE